MLALGIPAAASADCVDLGDGGRLAKRSATFVFDGTVLKVEQIAADGTRTPVPDVNATIPTEKDYYPRQFAATFEVHRVWKGDVSRTFTVYFVWNQDGPSYNVGQRGIVFARHESTKRSGLDPGSPLRNPWVGACSGYPADDERVLKQLGRARKPRR